MGKNKDARKKEMAGAGIKVRVPFVQTLCIEKDSYMDAI